MKLTCPSQNRLREYLEGSVNETDSEKILDHIEGCSSCDHLLATMESEQNDVMNEVCEFVRTESLLQEPEFEQLRDTARFSQADTIAPADVEEHPETGKRLRDYRLVKKIGEGGMGTVYQAFHVHLAKHVAVKILPADKLRSAQAVKRFRQEMRAVGKVNHSNVVSASDAGTVDGQHFLVMELIQGADLARIIRDRGPLSVADACEIVRQAAIGLQHAHDNGLVHRDVKPSNIMLALDGSVKLLDLGLAGLNSSELESTANVVVTDRLTSVGQIMGTLDYMAPEQITASPQVDSRADVYALGATLFQLLTGRTPCGDRSEGTPQRIEAVLQKPPLDIATLRSDVPEELCALLLKMLAKKPEDRPQAAIDVASELTRFASDADLGALAEECRTSLDMPSADVDVTDDVSFVVSRATQPQDKGDSRRPFTAVAVGSLFLAVFAAVVYFIVTNNGIVKVEVLGEGFNVKIDGREITLDENGEKLLDFRAGDHEIAIRQGETELITDHFELRRNGEVSFRVKVEEGTVVLAKQGGRTKTAQLPRVRQAEKQPGEPVNVDAGDPLVFRGHDYGVRSIAVSPDGKLLASASQLTVLVRKVSDGEILTTIDRAKGNVVFGPQGKLLAATDLSGVSIWDIATGKKQRSFKAQIHPYKDAYGVAISPDGQWIALGSDDGLKVWSLKTGEEQLSISGHVLNQHVTAVEFSPDGTRIASANWGGYYSSNDDTTSKAPNEVKVWDAKTGKELMALSGGGRGLAFSPDSARIASGGPDGSASVWQVATGNELHKLRGHSDEVVDVAFSPDGKRLATAGGDQVVKVWDLRIGEEITALRGHRAKVRSVVFSPDGKRLYSGSEDKSIKVWDSKSAKSAKKISATALIKGCEVRGSFTKEQAQITVKNPTRDAKDVSFYYQVIYQDSRERGDIFVIAGGKFESELPPGRSELKRVDILPDPNRSAPLGHVKDTLAIRVSQERPGYKDIPIVPGKKLDIAKQPITIATQATPGYSVAAKQLELQNRFGPGIPARISPIKDNEESVSKTTNEETAATQIKLLEQALDLYKLKNGVYPSTKDGLKALVERPTDENRAKNWSGYFLANEQLPLDPWGNTYFYEFPGIRGGDRSKPSIWSLGPDGKLNTDDDVTNWDNKKPAQEVDSETEQEVRALIETVEELDRVLKTVRDRSSAQAAATQVKRLSESIQERLRILTGQEPMPVGLPEPNAQQCLQIKRCLNVIDGNAASFGSLKDQEVSKPVLAELGHIKDVVADNRTLRQSTIVAFFIRIKKGMTRTEVEKMLGPSLVETRQPDHIEVAYIEQTERTSPLKGSPWGLGAIRIDYDAGNKVINKTLNPDSVEDADYEKATKTPTQEN